MDENRAISSAPLASCEGRSVKAQSRTTDVQVLEKSDCAVVPVNHPNRAAQAAAEGGGSPRIKSAQAILAILLARAIVAMLGCARDTSCSNHAPRPEDCFCRRCKMALAPCTSSFRKYLLPRLLIPSSFSLPPVEYSAGTSPSQAEKLRALRNSTPLPIAETIAVAVSGPMPDQS
jgi:hypothetical protein